MSEQLTLAMNDPEEETGCVHWLCGYNDPDAFAWWKALPRYEREWWLQNYRSGREAFKRGEGMPVAGAIWWRRENLWKETNRLAESWAKDIRQAFLDRKPCPIIPAPGYEYVLAMAFNLAQVPAGCLPLEDAV